MRVLLSAGFNFSTYLNALVFIACNEMSAVIKNLMKMMMVFLSFLIKKSGLSISKPHYYFNQFVLQLSFSSTKILEVSHFHQRCLVIVSFTCMI